MITTARNTVCSLKARLFEILMNSNRPLNKLATMPGLKRVKLLRFFCYDFRERHTKAESVKCISSDISHSSECLAFINFFVINDCKAKERKRFRFEFIIAIRRMRRGPAAVMCCLFHRITSQQRVSAFPLGMMNDAGLEINFLVAECCSRMNILSIIASISTWMNNLFCSLVKDVLLSILLSRKVLSHLSNTHKQTRNPNEGNFSNWAAIKVN